MFQPADEANYPVIPAPSMRRRSSSDLEELGEEIRRLEGEVDDMDTHVGKPKRRAERVVDDVDLNVVQQRRERTERVVETRRSKVTKRAMSSKRYEGA